jgi:hypothetical protein
MKVSPISKCLNDCVKASKDIHYSLIAGKNAYTLSDREKPAKFAGSPGSTGRSSPRRSTLPRLFQFHTVIWLQNNDASGPIDKLLPWRQSLNVIDCDERIIER